MCFCLVKPLSPRGKWPPSPPIGGGRLGHKWHLSRNHYTYYRVAILDLILSIRTIILRKAKYRLCINYVCRVGINSIELACRANGGSWSSPKTHSPSV